MPDDSPLPEFHLPDWGTEGAPPEPAVTEEDPAVVGRAHAADQEVAITVERPVLLTAGSPPIPWQVETVHGLLIGHGESDDDDLTAAVEAGTARALAALEQAAAGLDASAVTDVRLVTTTRKGKVVVTATGTAVDLSR